ncbi:MULTISPECIES: hypothetical protein [Trichocoleus]|uniref:Uncharacterized protein n=1 Tax=Trichocoleus desertorum GB2-A4 TaxID=2933944 RepID=A0ABV0JA21_9CYAN|nr:hypothetical protein [Trichocoleus sp. FACHB-46]MBD1861351.1 hypothetical protein [Trichocoleus sp. FACHB-46]
MTIKVDGLNPISNTLRATTNQVLTHAEQARVRAADAVSATAQQAQMSITYAVEQAKSSVEGTVQQTGSLSSGMADAMQNALGGAIQQWMAGHQFWAWLIQHPLISVGLLLVLLVLLQGLFSAIAQLIQRAGLALLRSPWQLSQWLFGFSTKSFQAALASGPKQEAESKQQRLTEIVNRLEVLKREQDALLQEVKAIVASDSATRKG